MVLRVTLTFMKPFAPLELRITSPPKRPVALDLDIEQTTAKRISFIHELRDEAVIQDSIFVCTWPDLRPIAKLYAESQAPYEFAVMDSVTHLRILQTGRVELVVAGVSFTLLPAMELSSINEFEDEENDLPF